MTDGDTTFDYHGYSRYEQLISHHRKGWGQKYEGWDCTVEMVDFDLLNTESLNARKMKGSDQYLHNPVKRAEKFIEKFDHALFLKAETNQKLASRPENTNFND